MLYLVILLLCHVILGADPPSITDVNFIKTTLEAHNLIRSKVTPTASNMKYMTWDSDLAKIAKSWTSKCIFDHNTNLLMKGLHPVFSPVGENLLMGPGTEMMGITKKWADEVAYYNFDTNGCLTGKMCGHYTQVVWANSYKVGCAATKCPGSYGFIVACNYGPAGNFRGSKPYHSGVPCSECPGDQCENNLCNYSSGCPHSTTLNCNLPCLITVVVLGFLIILNFIMMNTPL
ncbi:GLIPR1-like protein 1 isoform X2 [Pseudophryne corroboree]|uniref:GLIPR1-like protein 1 isoform X2 n=1 Tax=Pseudophryne corroboree TaxID=495146 RepID=UPI0030816097